MSYEELLPVELQTLNVSPELSEQMRGWLKMRS